MSICFNDSESTPSNTNKNGQHFLNLVTKIHLVFREKGRMFELAFLAMYATCIAGMIKVARRKRVSLPAWEKENGKREVENWLKGFLLKLKRISTRTERCRLILSVERMKFDDEHIAATWKDAVFNNRKVVLYDRKGKSLETLDMTYFQKEIIKKNPGLLNKRISRYDIKEEYGKWELAQEVKSKLISSGGEAIILAEQFGDLEVAVRIHVFDPFLFTDADTLQQAKIHFAKGMNRKILLSCYICVSRQASGSHNNLRVLYGCGL